MQIFLFFVLVIQALFIFRFHFDISSASPFAKPLPLLRKVTNPLIKPLFKQLKDPAQAPILPIVVGVLLSIIIFLIVGITSPLSSALEGLNVFFRNWLSIVFIVVIINVIMSWVSLFKANFTWLEKIHYFAYHFCEPMLVPIRKVLPPMGGLDLSPMLLILVIQVLINVV